MVEFPQEVSINDSQQLEDLELVRRSQSGDTKAFDQLVTKYRAKVFTMVHGMVRNEHDASDLAQEAFLKAWRSIHQFEGRSSFCTWLYRLTMNVTIDLLRRKRQREEVELIESIASSLPSPRAKFRRTEIQEKVELALAKLSPEHRAVVVLKELEGLQYREIGEVLNLPVGTVMSRFFYARKQLQLLLRSVYNQI